MAKEKEIWKIIPSSNQYEASNLGNIRIKKTKRVCKQCMNQCGYLCVGIKYSNGHQRVDSVHTLVTEAFYGYKASEKHLTVDHIDGNKLNNRIDNLEYVTYKENSRRAKANGLSKFKKQPIKCLTDGKKFDSIASATRYYKLYDCALATSLYHKNNCTFHGLEFEKIND